MTTRKVEQNGAACKENVFIQVAGVMNGSPAAKAGLQEDDVILTLGGSPTCTDGGDTMLSFKKLIERQKTGVPLSLDILRKDQKFSLTVVLEEMPVNDQPEANHPGLEQCPERSSTLQRALGAENALPLFNTISNELYRRSNLAHNPGSAFEKKSNPLQLREVTYLMRHPQAAGEAARELSERISTPLSERDWQAGEVVRKAASLLDIELAPSLRLSEITFPALLHVMEETKKDVEKALGNLTKEEKELLQKAANDPTDDSQWNKVLDVSMKVDREGLFRAFSPLLSFLTRDNLALLREDLAVRFPSKKGDILYEAMTPVGKVIVGGAGPNVYGDDCALILDLGGDDLYLNNAGGSRPGMPVSLVIDFGGNDRYVGRENFSQGAGLLGGGFLLDLGGSDTFVGLTGSQGAGFFGLGLLYHGDGDAGFSASRYSQGTGMMGIGLLTSRKGDSKYLCSFGGQGLGLFGGAGVLIDEEGNDFYQLGGREPDFRDPQKATQSFGQGFGLGVRSERGVNAAPGGIGMLIDEQGNDTYLADYFAQGASYYYGLGILDDRAGDDQYFAGRYAQGAGIHSSVGVLIDREGDDFYYSSYGVGQGMGHDYGVGFFEDDGGENRYQAGTLVQGAATNGSIGILIDPNGPDKLSYQSSGQAYAESENSMGIV
ncbi:MAG TPA: PDZ domain-containing protein, partial [Nitrospirota bacterium]|nr:PDZ domain-containing protein [Nitrospirota bacterium]